jgi:hypothetical protein
MKSMHLTALLVLIVDCSEPKATETSCVNRASKAFGQCMAISKDESCTSRRLEALNHCGQDVQMGKPCQVGKDGRAMKLRPNR